MLNNFYAYDGWKLEPSNRRDEKARLLIMTVLRENLFIRISATRTIEQCWDHIFTSLYRPCEGEPVPPDDCRWSSGESCQLPRLSGRGEFLTKSSSLLSNSSISIYIVCAFSSFASNQTPAFKLCWLLRDGLASRWSDGSKPVLSVFL